MNESPNHWAHYNSIRALALRPLPRAAVSAGPGQCAAWAEPPAAPAALTTTYRPVRPLAARRDPGLASPAPSVPHCPVLQAVPRVVRRLSLCLLEETSSQGTVPERHICLGSSLPCLHQAWRTCLSWDPQLQATALPRQSSPRSPGRQKVPRGGPTAPRSHNVLLLGRQRLMRLISTTPCFSLPASRLPAASAPGAASF